MLEHILVQWLELNSVIGNKTGLLPTTTGPNVVVEWLTLLVRIRDVSGSNLRPEPGYVDCGFSWLSSVPPGKCRDSVLNQATAVSFDILPTHHSPITLSFDAFV
jgi:hypothetical protein